MANHSRLHVLTSMIETGLVPIFYHPEVEVAARIVEACAAGGARCIEYTNRGGAAHLVFEQLRRRFESDERVILGVGSVVDTETAALYLQLGANFVVSPILNPGVARLCNRRKVAHIPGCGSVSEISQAEELGVEICKLFPGSSVGGPEFVRAVLGPMPWTRLMPTGGVEPTWESLNSWFAAGVACVGIGSKLISRERIAAEDYEALTENVREALAWIEEARGGTPPIA